MSLKQLYIGINGFAGSGKDTVAKMLKINLFVYFFTFCFLSIKAFNAYFTFLFRLKKDRWQGRNF